jgi:hypothetical protein
MLKNVKKYRVMLFAHNFILMDVGVYRWLQDPEHFM